MRRNSSGQVLIGAATLMLVILLTMAASLPVINTSIDPSSEAMNVMVAISETLAKRTLLEIGAAQCANEMIGTPTYAIGTVAAIGVSKARSTFVERLKKLYPGAAGIKDLKIEIIESYFDVRLPAFGGPAQIGGRVKSYPLGDISVEIKIGLRVTYYVDKGNGKPVFKKFTYYERFIATTARNYGGADVLIDTNPVDDLRKAMPGWLDTAIGFTPVIGDVKDLLGARTYFKYRINFNVGRAIMIAQHDASGFVRSTSKGAGATPSYYLTGEFIDAKVNEKLIVKFLNRPDKSYKVYLDKGFVGLLPTISKNRKVIELTEYYNIDWITVTLAGLGLIGDLRKVVAAKKQDLSRGNGLANENLLFSSKITGPGGGGGEFGKIQPIRPIVKSDMHNEGRMYKQIDYEYLDLSEAAKKWIEKMREEAAEEVQKSMPGASSWIDELIRRIKEFVLSFLGYSSFRSDFGKLGDEEWTLNSMMQQELLQNSGRRSDRKLFSDQDPFMWMLYPRPGGGAYSACLWLENFHPVITK